jgi:hypothetical protein
MELIKTKEIHLLFSNINDEMKLKGHAHHAIVSFEFETLGSVGFPAFKQTVDELRKFVLALPIKGFRGTNEAIIRMIHGAVKTADLSECTRYNGRFRLFQTNLAILGVDDELNHDEGATLYTIKEREYNPEQELIIKEIISRNSEKILSYYEFNQLLNI